MELLINDSVLRIRNWNIGAPTPIQATGKLAATVYTRLLEVSFHGSVEYFMSIGHRCFRTATDISERECSKKFVQQGCSRFDARSVLPVRERERREERQVCEPEGSAKGRERRWRLFPTFPFMDKRKPKQEA